METVRKAQVIEATVHCILEKGLSRLSVKDIARQAGVSTGIIYHYFENKSDLLLQVLKTSFQKSHEQAVNAVESKQGAREKFSEHIRSIVRTPQDNPEFWAVLINFLGEAVHDPDIRDIINKFFHNLKSYMSGYLFNPETDAALSATQNHALPTLVYALGLGLGIMWTLNPEAYGIGEMEKLVRDLWVSHLS
ncbi:MAG: TetR/AcrR family transcriptional regulator [Alicyclobacillus macrosporangiidus]|nr:TetR/AcrR family transcriptional regulator [Alicyclobacillus macrosporangiidus]